MRNVTRTTSLVVAGALAASIAALAPASAATTTTFEIEGGALNISQPGAVDLGKAGPLNLAVAGTFTEAVVVTDERNGVTGWTASVESSDFTTGGGGQTYNTVPNGSVFYTAGAGVPTGVVTALGGAGTLEAKIAAMTASAVVGNNAVSWNPLIEITLAAEDVAGVYTGTITHSVA